MFFDSHAHFEAKEGKNGFVAPIERARKAGVERILAVGGSRDTNELALKAARLFPATVSIALGYDREQVRELAACPAGKQAKTDADLKPAIRSIVEDLERKIGQSAKRQIPIAAIGETGLDLHYSPDTADAQILLFREQLALARSAQLPVVVHSRDAADVTGSELSAHANAWNGPPDRIGVLHCFTGTADFAQAMLALGFHVSFSGIVTFASASALREVVRMVPDDRLLIESDSPYLAPVPHRGKRNEPAHVKFVAEAVAKTRSCPVERIADLTFRNAQTLFGRPDAVLAAREGGS